MLRGAISKRIDNDPLFQWRGENVTRIENLSDIVFALALGMVVSTSTPPVSFDDLGRFLLNIFPVSAAFLLLLQLWNTHFVYFRRYGLADGRTILLNAFLLLIVMFLAYPLRFVFDGLFGVVLALFGHPQLLLRMEIEPKDAGVIMAYFAVGYGAAYGLIGLLYSNALHKAEQLVLDATEIVVTKRSVASCFIRVFCSALVVACALLTPLSGFAGFLLFLYYPLRSLARRKYKIPKAEFVAEPEQEPPINADTANTK